MALDYKNSAMLWENTAEEIADLEGKIRELRSLILDMGRAVRSLDDNNDYLELWTQDGDYILDGRWKD